MPQRFIAALFLSVWFILLGMEAGEQAGYFEFPDQDVDRSVDLAVLSLGTAVQLIEDQENGVPGSALLGLRRIGVSPEAVRITPLTPWHHAPFPAQGVPLRTLHCRFLI